MFVSSGYIAGSRALRLTRDGKATRAQELWYDPHLRFTFLNPIRVGDFVYGTSGQGATAIMTAAHIETGETAWRKRGFSRATLLYADDKLLILEEDGDLTLARLDVERDDDTRQGQDFRYTFLDRTDFGRHHTLCPRPRKDHRLRPKHPVTSSNSPVTRARLLRKFLTGSGPCLTRPDAVPLRVHQNVDALAVRHRSSNLDSKSLAIGA